MDTVALVDEQVKDGERLLDRLVQEGVPVRAAGWVKPTDEDRWSLYLVTPLVEQRGPIGAYRDVYRHLRSLGKLWITDSDVKLVGEGNQVGKDLLGIVRSGAGSGPIRSRRPLLGGLSVEGVYVYPALRDKTPGERLCLLVAYAYRREDHPASKRWHVNCREIAPTPDVRRPGLLHVLERANKQVTLIFAVPCDEQGTIPPETRDEYEDEADAAFMSLRPEEELA